MQYRPLGKSGINVSLMSLGTGGPSNFGQRTGLDDAGRKRLVARALELGVNLFDTSEQYRGAEEMLGKALEGVPRDNYYLATKWSYKQGDGLKEPESLVESVDRSLRRMNTDVIDLMQFHGIFPEHYDTVIQRYVPTMLKLRDQGKIRLIGYTEMMTVDPKHTVPARSLKDHPHIWEVIMLKYGILNQWAAKEVLPLAEKHGVGILNMAPVRLTLTREADRKALWEEWKQEGSIDLSSLDPDDPFGWLVQDGVESVIDAGYRFAAMHPAVSTVLTGTSSIEHLEANARSLESAMMPEADYRKLVEIFGESAAKS
jgi:L-galactose dehydrogenase